MSLPNLPETLRNLPTLREFLASLLSALTSTFADLFALDAENVKRDGSVPFTGDVDMGGHRITNLGDPIGNMDATNKQYVDDAIAGGIGSQPPPASNILTVVNQASGSLSTSSGTPTALPSSTFSFTLSSTAVVAIDVFVFSEIGSTSFDNSASFTVALKNTDTLVSTDMWQSFNGVAANGTPSANGTTGYTGIKRHIGSFAAGTYNFQLEGRISGGGTFTVTYPLSIVVSVIG